MRFNRTSNEKAIKELAAKGLLKDVKLEADGGSSFLFTTLGSEVLETLNKLDDLNLSPKALRLLEVIHNSK